MVDSSAARRLGDSFLVPLLIGGAGTLFSLALGQVLPFARGAFTLLPLWAFLLSGFVYFARMVPIGSLFAYRASDLIWGVGLAAVFRLLEGLLSGAASAPFPTATWSSVAAWIGEVFVPAGLIGPVVEELYFRAFLTVAVFRMLVSHTDATIAGLAGICVSAGAFVLLHACFAPLALTDALVLLLLGAFCATLVMLTGRIWGAVLLHVSYNVLYLTLAALGATLA